jgi:hypothetical protein
LLSHFSSVNFSFCFLLSLSPSFSFLFSLSSFLLSLPSYRHLSDSLTSLSFLVSFERGLRAKVKASKVKM